MNKLSHGLVVVVLGCGAFLGFVLITMQNVATDNTEDTKAGEDALCYLRVRKDPEWFQTMLNLHRPNENTRSSVKAVTRKDDPSEYTHVIVSIFHSPGLSNYDPELKKLPNLTSVSLLMKLDKNCDPISTEEIVTDFDRLKATLNMQSVRFPNWVW